ncbi:hypothetical protein [Nostoc sp. UHCC 0251]|uniref:hypothetical protein n=1 Tax=Nostoc sp. UHCC 0251 TaxID=3110240 RepID=UPI002B1FD991|nr:hypothetical protein [Nostoc sp. UHCC 0251]MEA5627244.1 hypothetical protein [Nostoc sp. UHCC 0251]
MSSPQKKIRIIAVSDSMLDGLPKDAKNNFILIAILYIIIFMLVWAVSEQLLKFVVFPLSIIFGSDSFYECPSLFEITNGSRLCMLKNWVSESIKIISFLISFVFLITPIEL